jgi:hypothetical protein
MALTRREFGRLALTSVPAAALFDNPLFAQARPNSLISGVQLGTITYSFRSMDDQSAEATLKYAVAAGISAVELMGGPVNAYARARTGFEPPNAAGGGRGGGGRGGGRGGRGGEPPVLSASWNGEACAPGQPG